MDGTEKELKKRGMQKALDFDQMKKVMIKRLQNLQIVGSFEILDTNRFCHFIYKYFTLQTRYKVRYLIFVVKKI